MLVIFIILVSLIGLGYLFFRMQIRDYIRSVERASGLEYMLDTCIHKVEELGRTLYIPRYFVGDDVPFSFYLEEVYDVRDCAPSFNVTMRIVHSAKVSFGLSHVFIEVGDKMFRIDLREDDMFVTDDGFVGAEVVGGHLLTILREVDSYSQDVRIAIVGPCVFHRVLVSVDMVESMRQLVRIHKLLS